MWALTENCQNVKIRDARSGAWSTVVQNVDTVRLDSSYVHRASPEKFSVLLVHGQQGALALQPALLDPCSLPGNLSVSNFVKFIKDKQWRRLAGTLSPKDPAC